MKNTIYSFLIFFSLFLGLCLGSLHAAQIETTPSNQGNTRAYLKQIPFEKLIQLYATHENTKDDPSIAQFARFFKENRPLFDRIIQVEGINAGRYYILYHGANGQRLIFDTLSVLYNHTHEKKLPSDFILLRDPRDPAIKTHSLEETLSTRWPVLPIKHEKVILEAITHRPLQLNQVPLLWKLISADVDWNEDLSPQERSLLQGFSQHSIHEYHRTFLALARLDWQDPHSTLSEKEKQAILAIDTQIVSLGYELALRALHILENNVDYSPLFRGRNLAVNLSLFSGCIAYHPSLGLYPTKDECTPLYWFAENLGYHQFETNQALREEKLLPILDRYNISRSEYQTLENIYKTLKPEDDQLLFQILVPKEHTSPSKQRALNRFFYISHPVGRPAYYLQPLLASEVLDLYQRSPLFLPAFLQLQGRFLFTEEGMLNPQSGIRMFVYQLPHASQERIQRYLSLLDQWATDQLFKIKTSKQPPLHNFLFQKKYCNPTVHTCQKA